MFYLLPREMVLKIIKDLNIKDLLSLAQVFSWTASTSNDSLIYKKRLKALNAPPSVQPNKAEYLRFLNSRVARYQFEINYLQQHLVDIGVVLGGEVQQVALQSILSKMKPVIEQFYKSGEERDLIEINKTLDVINNKILRAQLTNLHPPHLQLRHITRLNDEILKENKESLSQITQLDFKGCGLETLSQELVKLCPLESLNCYENPLTSLPENIGDLKTLQFFYMSDGCLPKLPDSFYELENLRWLSIGNMGLKELSNDISKLTNLTWLYLEGNQLKLLPKNLSVCHQINELYLDKNLLQVNQPAAVFKFLRNKHIAFDRLLNTQQNKPVTQVAQLDNGILDMELERHELYTPGLNQYRTHQDELDIEDLTRQIEGLHLSTGYKKSKLSQSANG